MCPRKICRVLLIDEIDKSDIDLPNDLLVGIGIRINDRSRICKRSGGQRNNEGFRHFIQLNQL